MQAALQILKNINLKEVSDVFHFISICSRSTISINVGEVCIPVKDLLPS